MYKSQDVKNIIANSIHQSIEVINKSISIIDKVEKAANILVNCINNHNKILLCGNGGSAADCQHMAAEIIGRFEVQRRALPAIALSTDTSILTAISNDYGYEYIFSRQIEGLGQSNDVLIAISTSGNSKNIIQAIKAAIAKNMQIIAFTGKDGGEIEQLLKEYINLIVPSQNTAKIQEVHGIWIYILCQIIDKYYIGE